ncbi:dihydroneopterin aldolase [Flavobacteriales bacterium]|jgi:7,8-dihydroneopterin aldolase/epimerase/oxygenase|nr:dihydroneopterin aldolase [Flavobacteriales bacterium]MDG2370596.1 dihydroneopterin aldolase [Flavobacteriales bacterium]
MNVIQVHGIRCYSLHGCLKEETKIGGTFEVNIDVICDFSKSAQTDALADTIDYVRINKIVEQEMDIPSKLIESVAYRILAKLKSSSSLILKCKVEIQKINPPIDGDVKYVSVIVEE